MSVEDIMDISKGRYISGIETEIVWLEDCLNEAAGVKRIMEEHGAEFFKEGITVENFPEVAEAATTTRPGDISATKTRAAPYAVNGHSGQSLPSKFPYYGTPFKFVRRNC
jgi:hypothetical protein